MYKRVMRSRSSLRGMSLCANRRCSWERTAFFVLVLLMVSCSKQSTRAIVVFSDKGAYPVQETPVQESRFEENAKPTLDGYAGTYLRAVTTGDDEGFDQWITIEIGNGTVMANYSWKSWNDNPSVEPSRGPMRDVSITDNGFRGCQNIYGSSCSYVQGRFMSVTLHGRRYEGILESGGEGLFWTKQEVTGQ
jgi:hypothetical protein